MGIKYRCEECDYQANRKQGVDSHVKMKHMGIKFMCRECEYKAGTQQGLKMHKRSVHKFCSLSVSNVNIRQVKRAIY